MANDPNFPELVIAKFTRGLSRVTTCGLLGLRLSCDGKTRATGHVDRRFATRDKCIATSNKCLTSSNKKLLGTSASLLVTSALLVVTRSY